MPEADIQSGLAYLGWIIFPLSPREKPRPTFLPRPHALHRQHRSRQNAVDRVWQARAVVKLPPQGSTTKLPGSLKFLISSSMFATGCCQWCSGFPCGSGSTNRTGVPWFSGRRPWSRSRIGFHRLMIASGWITFASRSQTESQRPPVGQVFTEDAEDTDPGSTGRRSSVNNPPSTKDLLLAKPTKITQFHQGFLTITIRLIYHCSRSALLLRQGIPWELGDLGRFCLTVYFTRYSVSFVGQYYLDENLPHPR